MQVSLEVLDVRIDVELPTSVDPRVKDQVEWAWQHCLARSGGLAARRVAWRGHDSATGMHLLSQDVTRAAIDARAGQAVMLHAAAIANPDSGAALAVVGASGAGKTTWVQANGGNRRYISDEAVLITSDLQIFGIPKPLSLGHYGIKEQVAPVEFGLSEANGTEYLAGLWILDRDDAATTLLEDVEILDALPLLAQQASYLNALAQPLHQLAAVVSGSGGLRRARYREASDLSELVAESLA
ncbi:hypothetical protein J2X11_001011 [Aeromicrobium panaciterrae]|uniref:ATP-binding protein n=1 Tax=Aeromicrobium panaciterrae TaxID=363861 RepID=A0ABU1ULW1_9ACTN|nr:hypothetical protein [Aeromicrobium panaciterrae]MDR7086172.1 hypothetical protein [Aeromicrobium panaciterrae]